MFLLSSYHFFYCEGYLDGATLLDSHTRDEVYEWPSSFVVSKPLIALSSIQALIFKQHNRLDYPSTKVLCHLVSSKSLPMSTSSLQNFSCNSCRCSKSCKLPFSEAFLSSTCPLQLVYSDVWSLPVESFNGYKYYVIFVNHFTKYIWFYPLKRKSEVHDIFIRFKGNVEKFFNTLIV